MSEIALSEIAPEGVQVVSCISYGYPDRPREVEITAHRIDVPTGIGPARVIRLTIAREMFTEDNRPLLVATLLGRVKEAIQE